ncbi:hypothetical protein [Gimesia fumaroli]|uniref:Secreted protein n=1 Tax=Gimesia fumaroli TaxID=2527976 RepID=A0A518IF82_9PLAN|nr:hypothetical protein [Gimesia fumaroli]QDV51744.1 hypothetical protein Enr17x_38020 [Gimesia fumaroli]
MKRFFCLSLCALMLLSSTADAKKKYWKRARHCAPPCVTYAPAPCAPKGTPCSCALHDFGTFWIGEKHLSSDCTEPEPILLTGSGYSYGICQNGTCTGGNCIDTSRPKLKNEDPKPIINEPIHYKCTPIFDSRYSKCKKYDPRFIKIMVKKGEEEQKEIIVKLFAIEIDFNKIFVDYNSGALPHGDVDQLVWNYKLEDPRIIFVGFEATEVPPDQVEPDPFELKFPNNKREAIVQGLIDPKDPTKVKSGIILLAP